MFKFALNEAVVVKLSQVKGQVRGRADYTTQESQYNLYHIDGNGNAVYAWFQESDLERV